MGARLPGGGGAEVDEAGVAAVGLEERAEDCGELLLGEDDGDAGVLEDVGELGGGVGEGEGDGDAGVGGRRGGGTEGREGRERRRGRGEGWLGAAGVGGGRAGRRRTRRRARCRTWRPAERREERLDVRRGGRRAGNGRALSLRAAAWFWGLLALGLGPARAHAQRTQAQGEP